MMRIYARVEHGAYVECITPVTYTADLEVVHAGAESRIGKEVPIVERFTPEMVSTLVDITDLNPAPKIGWLYDGEHFAVQVPFEESPEEILAANKLQMDKLLTRASSAMTPLLVALQLGDATIEETELARKWQSYCRSVKSVDLKVKAPAWPNLPAL
ncbi:tail fiber assembly protein [Pseudomonas sp. HY13-MNA-CIBAN-0226]|uniref:tail fiber assembly protein n=1 Tax=Pseudomonas sp. HY13-MNA-CIBAN-0226 TaxID=3140473 RepID=UPI003317A5BE